MSLLDNLPHRCTLRSISSITKGELGGRKRVVTDTEDVHCWVQAANAKDVEEFDKRGIDANRKIYFATDPGVDESYQILITSLDAGVTTITNPPVLEVRSLALPDASAGMSVLYKAICYENTGTRVAN